MSRYIVTFISAGLVAVIPLVFNLMVVMCFLPWGTPVRATGLYPVVTGNVFENVFYNYPLLYVIIYLIIHLWNSDCYRVYALLVYI